MNREALLKEMKESIGTKEPIEFFSNMVDVFNLLFNQIDDLKADLKRIKRQSALAVQWDPKVASEMLAAQVTFLRSDKDTYANEIQALKQAFAEDVVTQDYDQFCKFWQDTLGFHPFLD